MCLPAGPARDHFKPVIVLAAVGPNAHTQTRTHTITHTITHNQTIPREVQEEDQDATAQHLREEAADADFEKVIRKVC